MTGMEISRIFYARYVQPMLERDFASERHLIAVGLAGQGSECLGFDDELSRDHDFGPACASGYRGAKPETSAQG